MQQLISDIHHRAVLKVDELTKQGWRIVPGTIAIHGVIRVPLPDSSASRDENGHVIETYLSVVLEKDDA